MAKATYAFEFNLTKKYVYFFAYSGEPKKTLQFFWNMHHYRWLKLNLADAFIKANPDQVDIEVNHDRDDTEYCYEIAWNGEVVAQRKEDYGCWKTFSKVIILILFYSMMKSVN